MTSSETLFGPNARILKNTNFRLLLLANVTGAPLGTALVSPLLSTLTGIYGISETQIGLMITAFTAPSIVLIPIIGVITDRVGRKPILTASLLVFGFAGTSIALTTDFRIVLLLRLVQGIGFAGLTPVIVTSIGDLYGGSEEATAQGLRFSTSGIAQTVFPLFAGVLVSLAWQYPLLLFGAAVPAALLVFIHFDEPTAMEAEGSDSEQPSRVRDILNLAAQPRIVAVVVGRAVPPFLYLGFLTFNSFIVVHLIGETPTEAGILVATCTLVYAVTASQIGRITDFFNDRYHTLIVAHGSMGVGVGGVASATSFVVAVLAAVAVGIGMGITLSMYRSIVTGFAPTALRGGLVSISESAGRAAATLAPLVMGAVVEMLTPRVGFGPAVRWTLLGFGILSTLVGIGCIVVAARSAEIQVPRSAGS